MRQEAEVSEITEEELLSLLEEIEAPERVPGKRHEQSCVETTPSWKLARPREEGGSGEPEG